MDDYPAKLADFVESIAVRIRELTVDRIAVAITWAALGIIIFVMGLVAVTFALIGLLRILGELVGIEWAYVILGGLFLVIAAFLWRMRNPPTAEEAKKAEVETKSELDDVPEVPEPSRAGAVAQATEGAINSESAERPKAPEPRQSASSETPRQPETGEVE